MLVVLVMALAVMMSWVIDDSVCVCVCVCAYAYAYAYAFAKCVFAKCVFAECVFRARPAVRTLSVFSL